jgi:S-adenosylmethionine hydrolase
MITLMTDLGQKDIFVGAMKGVIINTNPDVRIVDITHGISPQNVMEAALKLNEYFRYYPMRTIHVVVVDPGVGSERRPIIVQCDGHSFVGPDNGVFSKVISSSEETLQVCHITSEHYFLPPKGNTFHGRDIFASVAAWLSKGVRIESLGDLIDDYTLLDIPAPSDVEDNQINGQVLYSDGFGNAATNITIEDIEKLKGLKPGGSLKVLLKGGQTDIKEYFAQGAERRPHGLINSSGNLEIFIYMSNATAALKIKPGDEVSVKIV